MNNVDVGTPIRRSLVVRESADTADVSGLVLEFFSSSQGKWIAAEIIDRDDNGAVQVDAKPGVWLSAKDCKRKLRARAYLDDASIGSTILPPDAFLRKPDAVSLTKDTDRPKALAPKALSPTVPSVAPHSSALTSGSTSIGKKPAKSVSAAKLSSIRQSAVGGERIVQDSEIKKAPRLTVVTNAAETTDSRHACISPTSDTTQEPSPKGRVVPDPPSFQPTRLTAGPPTTYGPRSDAADSPSFETAVRALLQARSDQADKAAEGSQPATPRSSPTITDLPPGFQAGRQRNGLRFVKSTVPVAIQKEEHPPKTFGAQDELESDEKYTVEGLRQSSSPPVDINGDAGGETDSTRSSEGRGPMPRAMPEQPPAAPRPTVGSLAPPAGSEVAEAIAFDARGNPIITRRVSTDTGVGVTTVINEDGTKCTFGKNTLASLMSSDESETASWLDSLSCLSTRGLVHEIGQVLLSTSKVYQFHLDRLKALSERSHYSFFGLTEDATDAEVDRAYKKLAKQMHPDKNGGTEEAKEAFQQMKDKYEALKERRASQEGDEPKRRKPSKDNDDDADEICDEDTEGQSKEDRQKEAYEEDEEEGPPPRKQTSQISYDPTDQSSLASTALEMLQRLKAIEGSMSTVMAQLKQQGL